MPMRESLQLAAALAARRGAGTAGTDWRPLLRYAAGNPLTITVLTGQALRENLASSHQVEDFVTRLKAGEARLEPDQDTALGRTRSLAASLGYGFTHAFTHAERAQLAVLHLFRDTVDVDVLRAMGGAVPELAGLTYEAGIALLDRAADIGLLTSIGRGHYQIHPALPWFFSGLFGVTYGPAGEPAVTRAYALAIGSMSYYYTERAAQGDPSTLLLRTEEANLLHALDLARARDLWDTTAKCLRGLQILYLQTGRNGEWARRIADVTPDFTDPVTGGPLPGRDEEWGELITYRARLASAARDWQTAIALLTDFADRYRASLAAKLTAPATTLSSSERSRIHNLSIAVSEIGRILSERDDPGCLPYLEEALALNQRIGERAAEAANALDLGNAYLFIPGLLDLDEAERWFERSLRLRPAGDTQNKALSLASLGGIGIKRFEHAHKAGEPVPVLLKHLNSALRNYQQSLDLTPHDDHQTRGAVENQLGYLYSSAGATDQALHHYQRSLRHEEARGDAYAAGTRRLNIADVLGSAARFDEGLQYARAALDNYRQFGPRAAAEAAKAERLIAKLDSDRAAGLPPGTRRVPEDVPRSLGSP